MSPVTVRVFGAHPVAAAQYTRVVTAESDLRLTCDDQFDVGVFDGALPCLEAVLRAACVTAPASRPILLVERCDEDCCMRWIPFGIWGLVAFDRYERELPEAVRVVASGHLWFPGRSIVRWMRIDRTGLAPYGATPLTEREREVLDLLVRGLSNKEIGGVLRITERTAKFHVHNLLGKLHVQSRRDIPTSLRIAAPGPPPDPPVPVR